MQVEEFLHELFSTHEGYVYAPCMESRWKQYFFEWPKQKEDLIDHLKKSDKRDVYISPALFSRPRVSPQTFKGTRFLWTEFDGKIPEQVEFTPSIRIQSSTPGREHWYWRLDRFETNVDYLVNFTKRIAYHLEADLSGWDYQQVLRPPGSINHKRKEKAVVEVTHHDDGVYSIAEFDILPEAPVTATTEINHKNLPTLQKLLAKYAWDDDTYDLLTKNIPEGIRSDALSRMAFECVEMGMSNEETYVVLEDVDRRCKKFKDRADRQKRLAGIISYVRSKKASSPDSVEHPSIYRFKDFLETKINLKWVITGLLPVAGSGMIFGPSTVGKSTFTLRMLIAIASGKKEFLGWKIERRQKVGFMSMEMPHDELKFFIEQMDLTEDEKDELQDWFFVWPIGHAYPLDVRDQQIEVLKYIDQFGIQLLAVDSLGTSTAGSVKEQGDMKKLLAFLNEDLRKDRGCGYFFVHHPKGDVQKPEGLGDAYGDSYITNNCQTVLGMSSPKPSEARIIALKSRLSQEDQKLILTKTNNRDFLLKGKPVLEEKEEESIEDMLGLGKNVTTK